MADGRKIKYFTSREQWRKWLSVNFLKSDEVWLLYPKKPSGKKRILYNDAVEEALCFGWIDSIYQAHDAESTIQRFTPRKPKSSYSQANRERLKWLFDRDMIHPKVLQSVEPIIKQSFVLPADIIKEIQQNPVAWMHFQHFSAPYQRIRIAYIDSARKRPEEFRKRLTNFIKKTAENKLIRGFGGIDKYY